MDENYRKLRAVVEDSYIIGSYQRGYRWDEVNVKELLEDIFEGKLVENHEFKDAPYIDANEIVTLLHSKKSGLEYCLQPLVIKKNSEGRYSVIDGQQRLTTLYIILKALCAVSEKPFPIKFTIKYKSREKSEDFLQNISDNSEEADIDSAYMLQAYKFAKQWLLDRNKAFVDLLDQTFCKSDANKISDAYATYMYKILLDETKFIWDKVDESSADANKKEQKIFADRNTGKLELTDSELIKALFMNPEYYDKNTVNLKDRQTLISEIWDIYENELHREELWAFLPIEEEKREEYGKQTRMDAIFWLLAQKKQIAVNTYEEKALFKSIKIWLDECIESAKIQNDENMTDAMNKAWREVCNLFDGIKELFDNNEIYNLLSLYKRTEQSANTVFEKYIETLNTAKDKRTDVIKEAICENMFSEEIEKCVKTLRYPELEKIRNLLIAHNVAITNSSNPIYRFGFHFFKEIKGKWDIEHIYATNEGYIAKASMKEKINLLQIFSEQNENIYTEYIQQLYDINICEMRGDKEEKSFIDECFEKSDSRYDKYFDIWRSLKLRQIAQDLLFKYNITSQITEILESKNFDIEANDFLHKKEYDDAEVLRLLRREFLYWDDSIEKDYIKVVESNQRPKYINWHGYDVKIPDPDAFWNDLNNEKNIRDNFIRNYYRELLGIIYDNTGIESKNVSFSMHGSRREQIVNDDNRELIKAFLRGTKLRIEEKICKFFVKDESIDSKCNNKGQQEDYKTFAAFVNDNSMGNMMLLPADINRSPSYRSENFSGKRQFVVKEENVFLPIATSNVLMGKYIDLGTSTEQWLMNERKAYLEDMIETMRKYYKGVVKE